MAVQITAGSGTSIDSITVAGNERQIIVMGDPTTAGNRAAVTNAAAADSIQGLVTRQAGVPAAAALADTVSTPTTILLGSFVHGFNGTTWDRLRTAGVTGALMAGGATAINNAVAANPVTIGGVGRTALQTAVTAGNVTDSMYDKYGRQVVIPATIRDLIGTQTTTISNTSETTIVTAAANIFNDLMLLVFSNTSATAVRHDIRDTTSGSILFSIYLPAGDVRGFSLGGVVIPQTTVNTNWTAQASGSVTDVRIYAVFAKNK